MTTLDPRTPVVVGAAEVVQRPGDVADLLDARGPIELMVDAARDAAVDAGAPGLTERIDWVGVAGGYWRYRDPGGLVAALLGSAGAASALTGISGSAPQEMLGIAAHRISTGALDVALVVGGEARWTSQRLKRRGDAPTWNRADGPNDAESLSELPAEMLAETAQLGSPAVAYALFDDSRRRVLGESVDAHRDRIATLWAGFSEVAATNPHAWIRTASSAEQIRTPTADNRMISFPYTKAMVANNTVDMASAIWICSLGTAQRLGIAADRLVFPRVVTLSHETWRVGERDELHGSPALATAGRAALAHMGIGPDDVTHTDLYACFPSIVQMSADALGLATAPPPTVTGGLGFAGAAIANAVGHAMATMVHRVRSGGIGLVHGNGGTATKHSFGLYATDPPSRFVFEDCQGQVDHHACVEAPDDWTGRGEIEAATVPRDRDGPTHVLAALRLPDGRRAWAATADRDTMVLTMSDGIAGRTARRGAHGTLHVDDDRSPGSRRARSSR